MLQNYGALRDPVNFPKRFLTRLYSGNVFMKKIVGNFNLNADRSNLEVDFVSKL